MRIKCALIIICIHLDPAVIRLRFAAPRQEPRDDNVFLPRTIRGVTMFLVPELSAYVVCLYGA